MLLARQKNAIIAQATQHLLATTLERKTHKVQIERSLYLMSGVLLTPPFSMRINPFGRYCS
jgi:hypothetical protein